MQPKLDDDEEASTPRMDEASPLQRVSLELGLDGHEMAGVSEEERAAADAAASAEQPASAPRAEMRCRSPVERRSIATKIDRWTIRERGGPSFLIIQATSVAAVVHRRRHNAHAARRDAGQRG